MQNTIDRLFVLRRTHDEPDTSVRLLPVQTRCVFFSVEKMQPPPLAHCLTGQARGERAGGLTVGLFLFLSVGAASLFSFIAITVWAGERRKEREAFYHAEVLKKIAELPESGPAAQEYLRERQRLADRNLRGGLRLAGLIVTAAGMGLFSLFNAFHDGPPREVGMIPLLVGLAIFVYGQFMAPKG